MPEITFQYVKPTEEQLALMQKYRDLFQDLHDKINADLDPTRGKSLALTKLEETAMWLNKAITHND